MNWQYRIVQRRAASGTSYKFVDDQFREMKIEDMLNTMGLDRWELVAIDHPVQDGVHYTHYVFKRPI